ncbi:TolC family protein [Sporomusa sp. KB1]|jgi:TolC family type I secretion outer membrane protein|uniref:TolC family protein n=1 Tax=Sporomusa sp. KB1 TaxID=943346 RepID=UPI0011A61406|nr:TolC family protein [Sporomusa sp. KB1]TWH45346.1 TolC family type I secretion outer membrane protein [Sporomusa sp. KB1]
MVKFILSSRRVKQASALLTGTMLMAASLPGFAAPVELTLDEAVAMALKSNPSVKISESELEKANWDVSVAKAGKAPSVSLAHNASRYKTAASSTYVYNETSNYIFKYPVPDYLTTLYTNSIDMTLPLYTGGKLEGTIDKAKLAVKVADLGITNAQQQIKLDATNGYYSILQTRNLVTLREESLDRLTEHLKNVEAQYNAGTVAKTDVLRSEVEKADAEQNLIIAKNSYELAVSSLNNIISLPLDTELIVKDELKYQKFDKSLEDCIKVALTSRPDLAQAQVNVDIAKTSIKVAESGNKLTVAATASEKWHDSDFPGTENNTWSIGINASYNLFDGGLVKAQVKGSKAEFTKATEQLRQTKDSVQLEVRQAYLNMLEAEKRIETSKVAVVKGEEDYKIAQVRYSAGVGTNLDVIDSQVALTSAKTDYVQALYDYNTSRAKLNKAMGMAVK